MTVGGPVGVVWDGTRVYRVPYPEEIESVRLLSDGHTTRQVGEIMGLAHVYGAKRRINKAQLHMRALSPAGALYQMYRLQLLPGQRDEQLSPVLDSGQREILSVLVRLGLPYDRAYRVLGIGRNRLIQLSHEIYRTLGASNREQALLRAIEHGDVEIERPSQLWRGEI